MRLFEVDMAVSLEEIMVGRLSRFILILMLVVSFSASVSAQDRPQDAFSDGGLAVYLIRFSEPGLVERASGTHGRLHTEFRRQGSERLDTRSDASRSYLDTLDSQQDEYIDDIQSALNRAVEVKFRYKATHSGIAAWLNDAEAAVVRAVPGVESVEREQFYDLHTNYGPRWIGAEPVWNGSQVPGGMPHQGEGVIIGVLDTGINTDHRSFAGVGPVDGYVFTNPLGGFQGDCVGGTSGNDLVTCNNKLIGAWQFDDGPEDTNGHGSHTASLSGGNYVAAPFELRDDADNLPPSAYTPAFFPEISGVAPHANIIAYDVCVSSCSGSAISGGINQAILDGVDVINFSISGGNNPWLDADRQFLDAVNAGIFVAASAGNTRDDNTNPIADVNHKGPWVMTVANMTHDRPGAGMATDMSGGGSPPGDLSGQTLTGGYGPESIVYAGDFSNGDPDPEQCLNPFPANTWTNGEIVVCDRGAIARVAKGSNVLAGGAGGMILANIAGGATSVVADPHALPALHVDVTAGDMLRTWLASGSGHMATLEGPMGASDPSGADIVSGGSLIGPNLTFDVTKPDIGGPGSTILGAETNYHTNPPASHEFQFLSGTSMSSPHVAGAAALIRQVHPDWTVSEIRSAMLLTAELSGRKPDGTTPADADDYGNGRINITNAVNTSLVMDESFANYLAADPSASGDPTTLNLPGVRNSFCTPNCGWTRRVRSVADGPSQFSVSTSASGFTLMATPSSFELAPGDVLFQDGNEDSANQAPASSFQTISITASGVPDVNDGMSFGMVEVMDSTRGGSAHRMTVSVNVDLPFGGTPPPD